MSGIEYRFHLMFVIALEAYLMPVRLFGSRPMSDMSLRVRLVSHVDFQVHLMSDIDLRTHSAIPLSWWIHLCLSCKFSGLPGVRLVAQKFSTTFFWKCTISTCWPRPQ